MGLFSSRPPRIERLRRRGDVAGLCDALAYRDRVRMADGGTVDLGARVRRQAMAALSEIDDERVVAAATEALEDDDAEVQIAAVHALRQRRVPDPLVAFLVRSDAAQPEQVRAELREAIRELDGPGLGVSFAGRLIRDGSDAQPRDEDRTFLTALLANAQAAERQELARAAVEELGSQDEPRRERAFLVLAALGDPGIETMREALGGPRRAEAAAAIGRLGDSGALPALVDLLGDSEIRVRVAAARALGEIRDPRAVEGLLRGSTDSEFAVREAASDALDRLGTSAIVFAVAAFVQPLLMAGGAREQIEPGSDADDARVAELPSPPQLPDVPASAPTDRAAGTLGRLRRAARRARAGRQEG